MQAIPLGKVTVTTAGTPAPITAAMIATAIATNGYGSLSPGGSAGLVAKIEIWPDTANTGNVFACAKSGAGWLKMAAIPAPASGNCEHWHTADCDGNHTDPTYFAIDVGTSGQGAYITLWVE